MEEHLSWLIFLMEANSRSGSQMHCLYRNQFSLNLLGGEREMLMTDISIDYEVQMAYVKFNEGFSAEVVEVNDVVNVDLGVSGAIIGVEFFSLDDLNASRQALEAAVHIDRPEITEAILQAQELLRKKIRAEQN
jgi:uncharacterized protein YuzE